MWVLPPISHTFSQYSQKQQQQKLLRDVNKNFIVLQKRESRCFTVQMKPGSAMRVLEGISSLFPSYFYLWLSSSLVWSVRDTDAPMFTGKEKVTQLCKQSLVSHDWSSSVVHSFQPYLRHLQKKNKWFRLFSVNIGELTFLRRGILHGQRKAIKPLF